MQTRKKVSVMHICFNIFMFLFMKGNSICRLSSLKCHDASLCFFLFLFTNTPEKQQKSQFKSDFSRILFFLSLWFAIYLWFSFTNHNKIHTISKPYIHILCISCVRQFLTTECYIYTFAIHLNDPYRCKFLFM